MKGAPPRAGGTGHVFLQSRKMSPPSNARWNVWVDYSHLNSFCRPVYATTEGYLHGWYTELEEKEGDGDAQEHRVVLVSIPSTLH